MAGGTTEEGHINGISLAVVRTLTQQLYSFIHSLIYLFIHLLKNKKIGSVWSQSSRPLAVISPTQNNNNNNNNNIGCG